MIFNYLFTNKINNSTSKLLFTYIKNNNLRLLKNFFNNNNKNVNNYRDDYDNTLIHIAIYYSRINIMEYLLSINASMEIKNDMGSTPLDFLMRKENSVLLKKYIEFQNNNSCHKIEKLEDKINDLIIEKELFEKSYEKLYQDYSNMKRKFSRIKQLEEDNKRLRRDVNKYINMNKKN